MPEFLVTRGIVDKIDGIISGSKDVLFLISPYLSYIPDTTIGHIKDALKRGVKVALVFRLVEKIHQVEMDKLNSLKGLAFFNEREAVVTSFNLSGYSEDFNIEFGISITRAESREMFESLVNETKEILRTSKPVTPRNKSLSLVKITDGIFDTSGYCIRCCKEIEFNFKKPLCPECYSVWKIYNNHTFIERYCHFCGDKETSNIDEPFCGSCLDDLDLTTDYSSDNLPF